jgi:cytidine deaminase
MEREALLARARAAARRAYAPYSGFHVGAAVVVRDPSGGERVFTGANIENASYGLTLCAERAALAAALTAEDLSAQPPPLRGEGEAEERRSSARRGKAAANPTPQPPPLRGEGEPEAEWQRPVITQVAVACPDAGKNAPANERMPCGACRQWLAELAPDAEFYVDGIPDTLTLDDLLPLAFRLAGRDERGR